MELLSVNPLSVIVGKVSPALSNPITSSAGENCPPMLIDRACLGAVKDAIQKSGWGLAERQPDNCRDSPAATTRLLPMEASQWACYRSPFGVSPV